MQKNSQLIDAVLVDVPAKVKCFLNSRTAVTELLPPLLEIISPNLRPVCHNNVTTLVQKLM